MYRKYFPLKIKKQVGILAIFEIQKRSRAIELSSIIKRHPVVSLPTYLFLKYISGYVYFLEIWRNLHLWCLKFFVQNKCKLYINMYYIGQYIKYIYKIQVGVQLCTQNDCLHNLHCLPTCYRMYSILHFI